MKCLQRSLAFVFIITCLSAQAHITKIEITKVESPYNNGAMYGPAGQYERIYGRAFGEIDPENSLNIIIQDVKLAPRNSRGMVEYVTEFIILRPIDMAKSNKLLFLSLPNRGNVFPADTSLLRRGYIYVWAAWQGDVIPGNNRVTINVPVATDNGKEITGKIRVEYEVNDITKTIVLSSGYFNGQSHHVYETTSVDNTGLVLTKRIHEEDARETIPNSDWAFSDCNTTDFPGKPSTTQISLKDGFNPNYIYELTYIGKNPLVMGLGFAAIRDLTSFLRNQTKDKEGNDNPLMPSAGTSVPIKAAIMQGISQCGNFTRTFLQLGFNEDENHRIVFEGVNDHIGTRRISLNIRFGRPGGGGIQREDHYFPSNEPPFTWDDTYEPISGIHAGILDKCIKTHTAPKIMQTFSSSEYWQLRASLRTTNSSSTKDIAIPPNVRVFLFNSTQHGPFEMADKVSGFTTNSNNYTPYLRAIVIALEKWVMNGTRPPASIYPTIAAHTLVKPDKHSTGWPDIPGVLYTGKTNDGPLLDFGRLYDIKWVTGILQEPPTVVPGKFYHVLVPKVDMDGNEVGGIRSATLQAPLGTYTGWSLRKEGYGQGDLNGLNGMFIPFKTTKAERLAINDPRLSLEERYHTHDGYVTAITKAANGLVSQGLLGQEDADNIIETAKKSNVLQSK
jgi:hypothetical protein